MYANNVDTFFRSTAVYSISAYQKHLSPHKGFACPHRQLYGGSSCSDYVKALLTHQRIIDVLPMTLRRFHNCALASQNLAKSEGGCIVIPCCIPI